MLFLFLHMLALIKRLFWRLKFSVTLTVSTVMMLCCLDIWTGYTYAFLFNKNPAQLQEMTTPTMNGTVSDNGLINHNFEQEYTHLKRQLKPFLLHSKKVKSHLISFFPYGDVFTTQDQYTFSAELKNIEHVFVNGQLLSATAYFEYRIQLPDVGRYDIHFFFITKDNFYFEKIVTITRLISPVNVQNYTTQRESFVKIYNYLFSHDLFKKLDDPLSYIELSKLFNYGLDQQQDFGVAYLDNSYSLSQNVTRLQFYIRLLKRLSIDVSVRDRSPFVDVLDDHWAVPYLNAAIDYGLLSVSDYFDPYTWISVGDAISILLLHDVFRDITPDFQADSNLVAQDINNIESLRLVLQQRQQDLLAHKSLIFDQFQNNQFYPTKSIVIKGMITPALPFHINDERIVPNKKGRFTYKYQMKDRHDIIRVNAFDQTKNYNVFVASFYNDLKSHWFESMALKLQYLGFIEPDLNFKPQATVSVADFGVLTRSFFEDHVVSDNLSVISVESLMLTKAEAVSLIVGQMVVSDIMFDLPYWDVQKGYWAYEAISDAYSLQLISTNTRFYPDRPITKAELVSMLAKLPHIKKKMRASFYD